MKKVVFFISLFCFFNVYSHEDFLEVGTGIGYRKDWHDHNAFNEGDPDTVAESECYDEINIVQPALFLRMLYQVIYVEGEASYGWFWDGRLKLFALGAPFTDPTMITENNLVYKTEGEVGSIGGRGGFYIPLYDNCWHIALVPLGGYQYDHQFIRRKSPSSPQDTTTVTTLFSEVTTVDLSQANYKRTWKGPFAGGMIAIRPFSCFKIDLQYTYHWLKFIQRTAVSTTADIFSNVTGNLSFIIRNTAVASSSSRKANGHVGTIRFAYLPTPRWSIALDSKYLYYFVRTYKFNAPNTREVLFPVTVTNVANAPGLFEGHWSSFSIMVEGSFLF